MFDELDPWELIKFLRQRVQALEQVNNEILRHIEITTNQVDNCGRAIVQLQKDQVDTFKNLHLLNTRGEQHDKTSTNN